MINSAAELIYHKESSGQDAQSHPDANLVATLLPSGIVRKIPFTALFPETAADITGYADVYPESERELQQAKILTDFAGVSPAEARVIEREIVPGTSRPKIETPPGQRVVYVPVPPTV